MPLEKDNILEFNQYINSDKVPYIIYPDSKHVCANYAENSSTTNIGEHIPCGYAISTVWGFDHINIVYVVESIVWKNFVPSYNNT